MKRLLVVIFIIAGAVAVQRPVGVTAAAEEKIRFSVAAVTSSYMDEFVAMEKGYHREERLAVEMIRAGKFTAS